MKKKSQSQKLAEQPTSPVQTQALELSAEERAMRDRANQAVIGSTQRATGVGTQNADIARRAAQSIDPSLDRFIGRDSEGLTGFRRALTGLKAKSTANAYDNQMARMKERASASGFGGQGQGVTFGAENSIRNEQAGAISRIPGEVELEALEPEFQAMNMRQQQAGLLDDIGRGETDLHSQDADRMLGLSRGYDPQGYFGTGAGMEQQRVDDFYREQELARKRKGGIFRGLAKIGTSFIPGVGPGISAGI